GGLVPVVRVLGQGDVVAGDPLLEHERTGADRGRGATLGVLVVLEVGRARVTVLQGLRAREGERGQREGDQEGRVRRLQLDREGRRIRRGRLGDLAGDDGVDVVRVAEVD